MKCANLTDLAVVPRHDLVSHLQHQLAEQKRIDLSTSGLSAPLESLGSSQILIAPKETGGGPGDLVQLLLPADTKKQRKQVKQMFYDRGMSMA